MKPNYKAIVFDFDYTLGDSTKAIVESMNYALEKHGYQHRTTEEIRQTIGLDVEEALFRFEGYKEPEEQRRFVGYFVEKINEIVAYDSTLYPDTEYVLRSLKEKGYKIAIVSTKHDNQLVAILDKFQAVNLVDMIVGSNNVKATKPDPEGLLKVLKEMNLTNEELLYVGDSFVDAKAAQNARVRFAGVLTGTTKIETFEEYPHELIGETIADIYQYILSQE